jgi:hypothetical protein
VSVTAYHSFAGEVEASNTSTIRRLFTPPPTFAHRFDRDRKIGLRDLAALVASIVLCGCAENLSLATLLLEVFYNYCERITIL